MPALAEILVLSNRKEMQYKLLCVERLHQKKRKENELMILYILGFTFSSIQVKQQVIASFLTALKVNGEKKNLAINMIKNLYYFVYCYNIQQQGTSDSAKKKTFIIANLFNKLYLFSNESASKSISVDMI